MKSITSLSIALFASAAFTGAMAQSYVSGSVGQGSVDVDCAGIASCDKKGTAFKVTGGYAYGNGISAELGYIDFGKAKFTDAGVNASASASGFSLGAAFEMPVAQDFTLGARLGIASLKTKISGSVSGLGSASVSETNAAPYYGFYGAYAVSKTTRIEFGADFSRGEFDGEKADVRALTAGLRFVF